MAPQFGGTEVPKAAVRRGLVIRTVDAAGAWFTAVLGLVPAAPMAVRMLSMAVLRLKEVSRSADGLGAGY